MSQSLAMYRFNSMKFGVLCRQMAKEKHISQATMAAHTGLSYDTVGNIYMGKIQKIPFEYIFKFCIVLEVSMEVMLLLMLKGEDIDFKERILTYDSRKDEELPVPVALPSMTPGVVTDSVADTAVAVAAAAPVLEAAAASAPVPDHIFYTAEDIDHAVRKAKAEYEARIADLKEAFDKERESSAKHFDQLHQLAMGVLSHR